MSEKNREMLVLCAANAYEQKYFYNNQFENLPASIQEELHIICVLFTEEVGGIFSIGFEPDGNVVMETNFARDDFLYDEISSGLLVREIRKNRQELFESLKLFFKATVLKEDISGQMGVL